MKPAPAVILGCGTFGGIGGTRHLVGKGLDEAASFATMDEAARMGLHVWDTAGPYANGASDAMNGRWLRSRPLTLTTAIHIAPTLYRPAAMPDSRLPLRQDGPPCRQLSTTHSISCG